MSLPRCFKSCLLSLAVLAPYPAAAANLAVMEGVPASSSTVVVSTTTQRFGIATRKPLTPLDVNGAATIRGQETVIGTVTARDYRLTDAESAGQTLSLHDWMDDTQSGGVVSGFTLTDNGDGTVKISTGYGYLKSVDLSTGDTKYFYWGGKSSQSLANNAENWVYIDWNGGNIRASTTSTRSDIRFTDQFALGRVWRTGTDADIVQDGIGVYNYIRRNHERLILRGYERMSGAVVAETGTRNLTTTAGVFYLGETRLDTPAKNTSGSDTFSYYYRDGAGGWTKVSGFKQVWNDGWDNNSGSTAPVTGASKYSVQWVYVCMEGDIYLLFGQTNALSLAQAQALQPPGSIPPYLTSHALLAAKIIIQKSGAAFTELDSAWAALFTPGQPTNHNDLGSIQGGASDDYYHLTSAERTAVLAYAQASTQAARLTGVNWGHVGLVCRSTLTITGSTITVHASGHIQTPGSGSYVAGYLIDSACPTAWTCSSTLLSNVSPWRGEGDTNAAFTIAAREMQAQGAHNICVWAGHDAGTTANGVLEFWLTSP